MGTDIRPELSKKNKYYIPKHRFYELKHFCLQYHDWEKAYTELDPSISSYQLGERVDISNVSDGTCDLAIKRAEYASKMLLVKETCEIAGADISEYLLKAVTDDYPFIYLKTVLEIPCGKDMYFDRYRKFWWILSQRKGI